jgi:hypothetical protein
MPPARFATKVTLCKLFQAWRSAQILVYWKNTTDPRKSRLSSKLLVRMFHLTRGVVFVFELSCDGNSALT